VLDAENGIRALEVARDHPGAIDVVVTDLVMPGMTGVELSERLTREHPAARFIYMSGHSDSPNVQQRILSAGRPFLQKPFALGDLAARIHEVLK
jgi:YesN/AraC family two-component response regulator